MNERLRTLLAEVLDLRAEEITPEMQRSDTDAWDSMNHLRLITAIEAEFGTSFSMDEIAQVQTPAAIERIINTRTRSVAMA